MAHKTITEVVKIGLISNIMIAVITSTLSY